MEGLFNSPDPPQLATPPPPEAHSTPGLSDIADMRRKRLSLRGTRDKFIIGNTGLSLGSPAQSSAPAGDGLRIPTQ